CHAVQGQGGTVGPALNGVGRRLSREQILTSILFPGQTIAAGFENASVTLKSGAIYAGIVKRESDLELVLQSPEDGEVRLAKADLASFQRGQSAMPDGLEKFL